MSQNFPWPKESVDTLRVLAEAGLSSSQIANRLSEDFSFPVTKNMVVCKCQRSLIKLQGATKPPEETAHYQRDVAAKERVFVIKTKYRAPRVIKEPPPPAVSIPVSRRLSLQELRHHHCRWPNGNPGEEAFGFCGADVAFSGSPYCCSHRAIAYVPAPKPIKLAPFMR